MTTSPAGCASSTTLNVAVVPDSATDTDVVDNVNPGGVAATPGARFPDESNFARKEPLVSVGLGIPTPLPKSIV